MQATVETVFDAVYLVSVITIGILMIRGCKGSHQFKLFGLMAVVLGAGDSFHLIPRALALCTTGLENCTVPLGLGKWITSVTMKSLLPEDGIQLASHDSESQLPPNPDQQIHQK